MGPINLFKGLPVKIARIDPTSHLNITTLPATSVSTIFSDPAIMGDIEGSIVVPLITKNTYHIMFGNGVDFEKFAFVPKYAWKPTDGSIVFRFNNTATRELYESNIYYGDFINKVNESFKSTP